MPDMNPLAMGYGQPQPGMGQQNPMQGTASSQKATSMPGAVGGMVEALMGGYKDGMKSRAGQPGVAPPMPPGMPLELNPQIAMGGMKPPTMAPPMPMGMPPGGMDQGLAPPMAPPMPGAEPIPGLEGTVGLPGIGEHVGPPAMGGGGGMGIMDLMKQSGMPAGGLASLFGGGQSSPEDLSMSALFGGGGGGIGGSGGWGGMFG
jgi:hypothetical protein